MCVAVDAEVDFLLVDGDFVWLDLVDINMNADIDDLNNMNSGGLVFIKKSS